MSSPPVQYQGPAIDPSVPWEVKIHLQQLYQKTGNHYQGISLLNDKLKAIASGSTSTVIEQIGGGSSSGGGSTSTPVGQVNNLTGLTSYATQAGDNGALLILSDASPIALTLAAGSVPYFVMVANIGSGTTTLTPAAPPSGTSTISYAANPAVASMPLLGGQFAVVGFDGNNWFAAWDVVPISIGASAHLWLDSYDATTGDFHASQPGFADLSGTLDVSQLPANVPVVSFGTGAPVSASTEGFLYFDTTGSPYHGYVYHSGAWNQFS